MQTNLDGATLKAVRRRPTIDSSDFLSIYEKLLRAQSPTDRESVFILSRAILFLRADDDDLNRLGYSILVRYGSVTGDWEPLHAVASVKDYTPIVEAIERLDGEVGLPSSYARMLVEAHRQNFRVDHGTHESYRTRGQMELRDFSRNTTSGVIVAPTSYGKSEMIIERVRGSMDRRVCVLVPTKALIAQTRRTLLEDPVIREARTRIVVHPDAFRPSPSFLAVLTQERLFRLLQMYPEVGIDVLLVDEAHNLLKSDARVEQLSQVLLAAVHRNPLLELAFYTPFVADPADLEHVNMPRHLVGKSVHEYVKSERLFYTRLAEGKLFAYDQFLNRSFALAGRLDGGELGAIKGLGGAKNILYVNRPRDAEELAKSLAAVLPSSESEELDEAAQAVADLIHPSYSLVQCVRRGVLFHHGRVPESVRQYVEQLFARRGDSTVRFLAATSTLLEGVNTPADTLFVLSPSRGRGHLTRAAFRNLMGRVGRFKEIFDPETGTLDGLQPRIFILDGAYSGARFNPEMFLAKVADITKDPQDEVDNPLLQRASRSARRDELLLYLENAEPGSSGLESPQRATTDIGRLCFKNRVLDFDILAHEELIDGRATELLRTRGQLTEPGAVVDAIVDVFLAGTELDWADDLARLTQFSSARNFYAMFLKWRAGATTYKRMIRRFLDFWQNGEGALVYVGSAWGDRTFGEDGFRKMYVDIREKSEQELVNLAVAKIKEEQDFVDFRLMPYVEVLNAVGALQSSLYNRLKYGTDDAYLIAMLRNGFSLELARLVKSKYREYVSVVGDGAEVQVRSELPVEMYEAGENNILVYEASCLV